MGSRGFALESIKCFPFTIRGWNLKTQHSSISSILCLRKTQSGKSHDVVTPSFSESFVFKTFPFTGKHIGGVFTAVFNNMRTLKFKGRPTNAFFAAVNQMFGGSSQLTTTAEHCFVV